MLKKYSGFTLVELMAIIIILSIISLIVVPSIVDLLENAKEKTFKNNVFSLMRNIDVEQKDYAITNGITEISIKYENGIENSSVEGLNLNYNGKPPQNGKITINIEGEVALALHDGTFCAQKRYSERELTISKKQVEDCRILYENIIVAISSSDVSASADFVVLEGSKNSQEIINEAINVAKLHNVEVILSAGTYIVNDSILLQDGTVIKGEGPGTIIQLQDNHPTEDIKIMINNENAIKNISISDLVVDGNKDNQNSSYYTVNIHLTGVNNLNLKNLEITGSLIEGIYLNNSTNVNIETVNSSYNGYYREDASGIQIDNCNLVNVKNSTFQNNGFHGILLSNTYDSNITDTIVKDNGWDGVRIQWESKNNIIENLNSLGNFRGIHFTTSSESNTIKSSVFDGNYNGVVYNESWENIINDSAIKNSTETGVITVAGSDYNYFRNNTLENNNLDYNLYYGDQMME